MIYYGDLKGKFLEAAQEGVQKMNSLWPINQTIAFGYCDGKTQNGVCYQRSGYYEIKLNKNLVKKEDILEVAMHEILHSYDEVFGSNHSGEWYRRSLIIQERFNIRVQRCNHFEKSNHKYEFRCVSCGHVYKYWRKPGWYARLNKMKCGYCKNHIIEVEVKK